jgi:hypothetical protein
MNIHSMFTLLMVFASVNGKDSVHLEQNFRQIGKLATGLSYAHIHGKINFKQLKVAYVSVIHYLEERHRTTGSNEEKTFIETLSPQLQIAQRTLADIENLFFSKTRIDRTKRQIFLGIAMALGFINTGMSIYNTAQITKLYGALSDTRSDMVDGFTHVAHALRAEDHAIHQLTLNVEILKSTCQFVLERIENENNEIVSLTNIIRIITMVNNLNAELSAWGRGLDALSNGRLHPTLINPANLKKGLEETVEKARQFGLRPLHSEVSYIYKNPISFIATEKLEIIIFVHVPLVEQDPLHLFEYLAIPTKIEDIFLTIEGSKNILASDLQGQRGLELSEVDLLRCQTEDMNNGKLFICPNTNLVQNQIRKTCLGALFYGHQKEVMEKCLYFPHSLEDREEFAKQISLDKIVYFTRENITVVEVCPNRIRTLSNITGLTTITVPSGCKIVTENYTFKSPVLIDQESDFVSRMIQIPKVSLLPNGQVEDIKTRLAELKKIKSPDRIHLSELNAWIAKMKEAGIHQKTGYAMNLLTLIISVTVICVLVFLYLRYRKARVVNDPENKE